MTSRKRKQRSHDFISIKVSDYAVRSDAGINTNLLSQPYDIDDESEHVHRFETKLEITGECIDPGDRSGHRFDINMFGDSSVNDRVPRIRDLQERDAEGEEIYKMYRGKRYPAYKQPPGVAYLEKTWGKDRWLTSIWVTPQMVTDALVILSGPKQVYVSIHAIKEKRYYRIMNLSVQTADPADE
ncbi:MAG: hypothetical protein N0E59_08880 [Candidatus Thiodiazotropha taylori]|nr:hypothetical protein [Candidatus Thiodiazotropha taylori]MCG8096104.1 hypothetical protein [Candidatus Thiodiazotropha endolucinida]MCG8106638.1 hypothetical protein [Candidatus Thiodiazotropha taylori]MCG8110864.1 hypothetical protein [Candidatus Thiodiazotropha taylori]MCW4278975.1 hypothetical protein [Candidatus Thiodiazotropha taylori]